MEAIVTSFKQQSLTRRLGFILFAGLVLALTLIGFRQAKALTLSPPSLEYSVEPGDTVSSKIKLYNDTADTLNLTTSTANFGAKGETGDPDFKFDAPSADLASWIKVGQATVSLAPGQTAEVPFTVSVPANAEPGGHYAGIFFGTGGGNEGQVKLQSKLGALLIVRVSGNIREEANIVEFGVTTKKLNRLPVDLFMRVENSGNVHVRPSGTATVRNMFGGVAATIQINPKDGAVLPNSIRRFEFSWQKNDTDSKRGSFFKELGAEWRNFALGTYTVDIAATYGESKKIATATVKVTIFPWRVILVVVVSLIVLIVLLTWGMKRYNAMIISKAQAGNPRNPGPPSVKK